MDESTDDITAAATAPSPTVATTPGVRYFSTYGKTIADCGADSAAVVDQSAAIPTQPIITAGIAITIHPSEAISDNRTAVRSSRAARTR